MSAIPDTDRTLLALPKSSDSNVEKRISLGEYKNRPMLSLRIWERASESAPMRPTTKGVSFTAREIPALRAAIEEAEGELARRGRLEEWPADRETGKRLTPRDYQGPNPELEHQDQDQEIRSA